MTLSSNSRRLLLGIVFFLAQYHGNHVNAWSPRFGSRWSCERYVTQSTTRGEDELEKSSDSAASFANRRAFLGAAAMNIGLMGAASAAVAEGGSTTATIYKSGKMPIVPGAKPRDKGDVKGTRKDPDFLRSISGCKSQCQSAGDGSLAKSKEDCLSECQDICCKTYEQCTFDIVPRI